MATQYILENLYSQHTFFIMVAKWKEELKETIFFETLWPDL